MTDKERLLKLNEIITNLWDIFPDEIQDELNKLLNDSEEIKREVNDE